MLVRDISRFASVKLRVIKKLQSFDFGRKTRNGAGSGVLRQHAFLGGSHQFGFGDNQSGLGGFFVVFQNGGVDLLDESTDAASAGTVDNASLVVSVNSRFYDWPYLFILY